jgi:ubiquitin C-terminal hydrolase
VCSSDIKLCINKENENIKDKSLQYFECYYEQDKYFVNDKYIEKMDFNQHNNTIIEGKLDKKYKNIIMYRKKLYDIKEKDTYDYVGLKNYGNTCYFNSVIQLLYSLDCFRNYILNDRHIYSISPWDYFEPDQGYLLELITHLFYLMRYNKSEKNILTKYIIEYVLKSNKFNQESFEEYLVFILNIIKLHNKELTEMFNIKHFITLMCYKCNDYRIKEDQVLYIEVTDRIITNNISDKTEDIKDFKCENPKCSDYNKSSRLKRIDTYNTNDIILFNIKGVVYKNVYNRFLNRMEYKRSRVYLDIKYDYKIKVDSKTYYLKCLVIYNGLIDAGHYFVYLYNLAFNTFICINDSTFNEQKNIINNKSIVFLSYERDRAQDKH